MAAPAVTLVMAKSLIISERRHMYRASAPGLRSIECFLTVN
jgi:hypothetical protein